MESELQGIVIDRQFTQCQQYKITPKFGTRHLDISLDCPICYSFMSNSCDINEEQVCGNYICSNCVNQLRLINNQCPICRTHDAQFQKLGRNTRRMIGDIDIHCICSPDVNIKYRDASQHTCTYVLLERFADHSYCYNAKQLRQDMNSSDLTDLKIKSQISYKGELKHGLCVKYYKDGSKHKECTYIQGNKHGIQTIWLSGGIRSIQLHYDNGIIQFGQYKPQIQEQLQIQISDESGGNQNKLLNNQDHIEQQIKQELEDLKLRTSREIIALRQLALRAFQLSFHDTHDTVQNRINKDDLQVFQYITHDLQFSQRQLIDDDFEYLQYITHNLKLINCTMITGTGFKYLQNLTHGLELVSISCQFNFANLALLSKFDQKLSIEFHKQQLNYPDVFADLQYFQHLTRDLRLIGVAIFVDDFKYLSNLSCNLYIDAQLYIRKIDKRHEPVSILQTDIVDRYLNKCKNISINGVRYNFD